MGLWTDGLGFAENFATTEFFDNSDSRVKQILTTWNASTHII